MTTGDRIYGGTTLPSFERTIAAWVGPRPPGMPPDAINLAALGAVSTTTIDAAVPRWEGWCVALFVRAAGFSLFKVGGVTTEVDVTLGTTADPDAAVLGANDVNVYGAAGSLAYTATFLVNPLAPRFTISMPVGTFDQLTAGRATVGAGFNKFEREL